MKKLTCFFRLITVGLATALLLPGCGGGDNGIPCNPPPDENILFVSLLYIRQYYHELETFAATGSKLNLFYTDYTQITIDSGFTQEWSVEPDMEGLMTWEERNKKTVEWMEDSSAWKPIRHGDPLPVSLMPGAQLARFYVRADYKGMKSSLTFVSIYRQGSPLPVSIQ